MAYNPGESYFRQESRFSAKDAGGDQGDWSQYLQGDGSKMQAAMSRLNDSKAPPKTFNEQEDQVLAQQAEAVPLQQWEQGMQRNMNQFQTVMQTGFTGLNATQQYQQAKELAALQKQGIQQNAMFGAISQGLGMVGGFFNSGGGGFGSFSSPQVQSAGNTYGAAAFSPSFGGSFSNQYGTGRTLF